MQGRKAKPLLHPNGFILLSVDEGLRLHVWSEDLPPAQAVHTPIHDHSFDFISTILCGTLFHQVWKTSPYRPNPTKVGMKVMRASPTMNEDTVLVDTEERLTLLGSEQYYYTAGHTYEFPATEFHSSDGYGLTATLMLKTKTGLSKYGRVLCPVGVEPDNDFSRYVEEDELWKIISRVSPIWERHFR